ncbi:MAG: bifunctional folylpolyglutamate synthase/dihydrofolate synthase [Acetobacteraceae bacterium]|nr:bifunctional folylpolyglutamate synthase/dihydrofolate synthase [Acetobacteraceae bacterium]MBV8523327.1 bifunctional folylpolyglutamate synthase/dihydrofolate synthase [Acetobacteraceae bacterium]MBV8591443.1 bifunctional folylpolyglutamate synthase/dihydrofolate synthase [Acetobacteraceae bacterium]
MSHIDDFMAGLQTLHPRLIDLSLHRVYELLAKLGHPEQRLPPVIHVAGTNGKGSTCAFLRAMAEVAGMRVHVYTSPHLVRFNERIRVASELVSDAALIQALDHVARVNAGAPITRFELITATAFHLFAQVPAELCILEVGMGGRCDATNVIREPAACAITSISTDHQEFLGEHLQAIAAEKAGIIKPRTPVAMGSQLPEVCEVLLAHASCAGAPVRLRGRDWDVTVSPLRYCEGRAFIDLPAPSLPGTHQADNAGIAIAALRAAGLGVGDRAIAAGIGLAEWPARLQRLQGRLAATLPEGWELWLDGGHNPGAATALAHHLRGWQDRPIHILVGMKQGKDSLGFLAQLIPYAVTLWAVAEPGQHEAMQVAAIIAASGGIARPGGRVIQALDAITRQRTPARVLICGSLYLAGEVLKQDWP